MEMYNLTEYMIENMEVLSKSEEYGDLIYADKDTSVYVDKGNADWREMPEENKNTVTVLKEIDGFCFKYQYSPKCDVGYRYLDRTKNETCKCKCEKQKNWTPLTFKNEDAKEYTLRREDNKDVHFVGWLMGKVGEEGRFGGMSIYKTKSGKYVCRNRDEILICQINEDNPENVVDSIFKFFGMNEEAKKLYDCVEINYALEID